MSKTNIFASEHNESAVQTVRSTMTVQLDDNGTPVVSFATNRGKGSGAQTMPVSEYREYVSTLSGYASDGIPDEADIEQLSPLKLCAAQFVLKMEQSLSELGLERVRSQRRLRQMSLPR